MFALAITVIIVGYFYVFGRVTHRFLGRENNLYSTLIAPAYGMAVLVPLVFTLSRLGMSGRNTFFFITIVAFLLSILRAREIFQYKEKISNWKLLSFFGITQIFAVWPMLLYGLHWISFGNDDMTNYVLSAKRFYSFGFFHPLNAASYNSGRDYTQAFYVLHVTHGQRAGSELLLSFTSGLIKGDTLKVFMPTIVASCVALNFLIFALILEGVKKYNYNPKWNYAVTFFISMSPLLTLGVLYQLIAQVGGSVLCLSLFASVPLLLENRKILSRIKVLSVVSIQISAALIYYPEITPFYFLPVFIFYSIRLFKTHQIRKIAYDFLLSAIFILIFLQKYVITAFKFLISQAGIGHSHDLPIPSFTGSEKIILFPYYLIPHGLSSFIGLSPIQKIRKEPFESIYILLAIIIILCVFYFLRSEVMSSPINIAFIFIVLVAFWLYFQHADFGLFKLAMYATPFFIIYTTSLLFRLYSRNYFSKFFIPVTIILCFTSITIFSTQQVYVKSSTGNSSGGFVEIPKGSSSNLIAQIDRAKDAYTPGMGTLVSDASNVVLAKIEMDRFVGIPLIFPSRNYLGSVDAGHVPGITTAIQRHDIIFSSSVSNNFSYLDFNSPAHSSKYLLTLGTDSIFNRAYGQTLVPKVNLVSPPKNYLIFLHSTRGEHYYSDRKSVAFYQLEVDPLVKNQQMSSLGNYLLFQVISPTNNAHLVMEFSDTLLPQTNRVLPNIQVQGATNVSLDVVGHGSARIKSSPIDPKIINGKYFIQLHLDSPAKKFPYHPVGLNLLYGRKISFDSRKITTFGKAISLVQNKTTIAPSFLATFPGDLENQNLYYSGLYEDGWFSDHSYAYLTKPKKTNKLVIKGNIPGEIVPQGYATDLTILLNGKVIKRQHLGSGKFDIEADTNTSGENQTAKVETIFSKTFNLPKPDGRPIGGQVNYIGFN